MDFSEDRHIVKTFITETTEHLTEIEYGILLLERKGRNVDGGLVHSMFRAAHSIKAGANLLKFRNIETLSHELEGTLHRLRQEELVLNKEIVDDFLKGIDDIREMIDDLRRRYEID